MSNENQATKKKSGLIWIARVLYVAIAVFLLWRPISWLHMFSSRVNFSRVYLVISELAMFVLMVIALIVQFKSVILNKQTKVRGIMLFFAAMAIVINDVVRDVIRSSVDFANNTINFLARNSIERYGYIVAVIIVMISYYIVIRKIDKNNIEVISKVEE